MVNLGHDVKIEKIYNKIDPGLVQSKNEIQIQMNLNILLAAT